MAKPPRIVGTHIDPETGEGWAHIKGVGSPAAPYIWIEVPENAADAVVELMGTAHGQLQAAVRAILTGDPGWRTRADMVTRALVKLERAARRGRPTVHDHDAIRRIAEECRHPDGTINIYKAAKQAKCSRHTVKQALGMQPPGGN